MAEGRPSSGSFDEPARGRAKAEHDWQVPLIRFIRPRGRASTAAGYSGIGLVRIGLIAEDAYARLVGSGVFVHLSLQPHEFRCLSDLNVPFLFSSPKQRLGIQLGQVPRDLCNTLTNLLILDPRLSTLTHISIQIEAFPSKIVKQGGKRRRLSNRRCPVHQWLCELSTKIATRLGVRGPHGSG